MPRSLRLLYSTLESIIPLQIDDDDDDDDDDDHDHDHDDNDYDDNDDDDETPTLQNMTNVNASKTRTWKCPSPCLDHMIEALLVYRVGPAVKLQHLRLSQGLERTN